MNAGESHELKNERDLYRIIYVSHFLAMGALGAVLYSFRPNRDPMFIISAGTFLSFVSGGLVSIFFWKLIRKRALASEQGKKISPALLPWTLVTLVVIGAAIAISGWGGAFATGASAAIAVVSLLMLFIVYLVRTWGLK